MRVLHTSDWHLGKKLEGYSRLEEQKLAIEEIIDIANKEKVDIVLVAGDIYDVPNPPSEAEHLYYKALKELSNRGNRPVIVIAGNHDSPKKITASEPLARDHGILTFGKPLEKKELGNYGKFFISESYNGAVVIDINREKVFINALPYPSEKTLDQIWKPEDELTYSQRIGSILKSTQENNKNYKNIIISHLFTLGAENEGSERNIELGGSLAFNLKDLPKTDYLALGHIHKPMIFKGDKAAYSGSLLEYRSSESIHEKCVLIKDLDTGELKKIPLTNSKPIKTYTLFSIEEAILKSRELKDLNQWIYLFIKCDRPIKNSELKKIKENKNIIVINPDISWDIKDSLEDEYSEVNILDAFTKFYKINTNKELDIKTRDIFLKLTEEVE